MGLDMKRFESDLDSDAIKKTVARDLDDGEKAGVEGTPTVFINGQRYNGDLDLPEVRKVIDAELKRVTTAKK
jgi:protein-disulfide isomerase